MASGMQHQENEMRCGHASTTVTDSDPPRGESMLYRVLSVVVVVEGDELVVLSVSEAVS
ncbi:hypothetical protein K443DRAFT_680875 [Laccaria amethystina LaAM-08-1]|uniref:Uncharacterized protein n=1 Tax=Laccaria amethystina LaAM-08-1 TaxID=1095629 RepID=A0A0C9XLA9_9AGAR|nr:hypothetical protein K443DRAFT_680875 [Laccaria amethystina LaAM-08-1]